MRQRRAGVARIATEDATAIFTRHRQALERLAVRITGDREDACDLVADAFATLLESGPSDAHHAVAWLFLTVRHRAYNRLRNRSRVQRRLSVLATETGTSPAPESVLGRDDRIRWLLAGAAASLSERDRIALSLRHVQGAEYADIAAALGTTLAQARVVVHRATERLRRGVVTALRDRHEADEVCAGSLAERGVHDGCSRCVSLADELAALTQAPVLLPIARRARAVDVIKGWWRRSQSGTARAAMLVGEAMAPAAALVVITAGPALPAVPRSIGPPTPATFAASVVAGPPADVAAGPSRPVAAAPREPPPGSSLPPVVGTTIGTPLHADDPGSSPGLARSVEEHRRSVFTVIGLPIDLPDPLDAPQGPQVDITSVELATLAGADGRPAALRWRIGFAAPPPGDVFTRLMWSYTGTACYSDFGWPGQGAVTTSCDRPFLVLGQAVGTEGVRMGTSTAQVRFDGAVLEIALPFASLDEGTRRFLGPGAELTRIVATASCNVLNPSDCQDGDRAPDDGAGYAYRIEG